MMVTALGVIAAVIMLLSVSFASNQRSEGMCALLMILAVVCALTVAGCLTLINQEEMIYIPR